MDWFTTGVWCTQLQECILLHWWKCEEDASQRAGGRRREGSPFGSAKDSSRLHAVLHLKGQIHSIALKFAVVLDPQVLQQLISLKAEKEHCLLSNINILHMPFQLKSNSWQKKPFQSFTKHECAQPTSTCNVFKQMRGSTAISGTCQN